MVLGDVVVVAYGGRVPLILRQILDFYSLIGDRFVHDLVEFEVALSSSCTNSLVVMFTALWMEKSSTKNALAYIS
jgi:hypothetical protein